jgi:hypothetical protein
MLKAVIKRPAAGRPWAQCRLSIMARGVSVTAALQGLLACGTSVQTTPEPGSPPATAPPREKASFAEIAALRERCGKR